MPHMIVRGPTWSVVVQAISHEQAKNRVLEAHGLTMRPWLARDWRVRLATEAEVEAHLAQLPAKLKMDRVQAFEDDRLELFED
jgi:hypothetical protein